MWQINPMCRNFAQTAIMMFPFLSRLTRHAEERSEAAIRVFTALSKAISQP